MRALRRALPVLAGLALAVFAVLARPIVRTPAFHHYADARTWLGIPHAGDVLSNLPFVVVAALTAFRLRGAYLACAGVALIGVGSAAYHASPSDTTLAFDWLPIVLALAWITAAVVADRHGARAGHIALVVGSLAALASVAIWYLGGGTTGGGDMTAYVAVQLAGVALPVLVALSAPGRISARLLALALVGFSLARLFAARDAQLLAALGISGHSLKHIAAALAAAIALRAVAQNARP
ncbi:MAG: hypothetical protein HOV81_22645 [Kofleriaceae bacterium]|nr:hypothetical protein [Kofleriaceae bacterium]